jgi:hypothetical protein
MFSKQFDMSCTHDRFCTKWCFDRVHRQCYRLTEAFNQVYDETIPENSKIDKRKQLIESWQKKQEFNMQVWACLISNPKIEFLETPF